MHQPTCQTCRFWWPSRAGYGQCHRYAPRAANQAVLFGAEAVIAIADIFSRHHGIEWPEGIEAEPTLTSNAAMFPRTYDADWCGEYELRPYAPPR